MHRFVGRRRPGDSGWHQSVSKISPRGSRSWLVMMLKLVHVYFLVCVQFPAGAALGWVVSTSNQGRERIISYRFCELVPRQINMSWMLRSTFFNMRSSSTSMIVSSRCGSSLSIPHLNAFNAGLYGASSADIKARSLACTRLIRGRWRLMSYS